jgi:hypothetical protein
MKKINKFITVGLFLAFSIISVKSTAQPSLKWTTNYGATNDSGFFFCISNTGQYSCNICGTNTATDYMYWIHIRNLEGADLAGYCIDSVVFELKQGGTNYVAICNPFKNWDNLHGGGFPYWPYTIDGGTLITTTSDCWGPIGGSITDHYLAFLAPSSGGGEICALDHFMVFLSTNNEIVSITITLAKPGNSPKHLSMPWTTIQSWMSTGNCPDYGG